MLIPSAMRQRGFSLIELMIAMVIGLVVTGAVVAFIFSLMRANTQTLSALRLNSELRTSVELISRELRRAAFVLDPVDGIGTGCKEIGTPLCPYVAVKSITISDNGTVVTGTAPGDCLQFSYQTLDSSNAVVNRFQAIRIANGALQIGVAGGVAVACSQATNRISSNSLTIGSGKPFSKTNAGGVLISLSGALSGSSETKIYETVVDVRSGGA